MIDSPRLEQWSEDMDSAINLVLELLGDWMKHIEINAGTGGEELVVGMPELAASEDKWEVHLNEVADCISGVAVFAGGRWFRLRMECVDFLEKHIPVGQFQWFIDLVSYLQFVKGETVLDAEFQRDEVHPTNVWNEKDQSIFISEFKIDMPPILGGLG